MSVFDFQPPYTPAGDQPKAIRSLVDAYQKGVRNQTLLGVTGSGKTFTVANMIAEIGKPTLVIAHNKTLAAQLAQEYQEFFPNNAVHYFVSYYDYYQPEAYMPITDTYIEKDAQINEEIDRLRHASTQSLLTRQDVIIVASVSCLYGLGSPEEYEKVNLRINVGDTLSRSDLMRHLIDVFFKRTTADLKPGTFRALGNRVEVMPVSEKMMYQIEFVGNQVKEIIQVNPVNQKIISQPTSIFLFPAKHFISDDADRERAFAGIEHELTERLKELEVEGKVLEVERLKRRTRYDLAMMREVGYCSGIENYSRHFSGKAPGEPPETLLSYFPHDENGHPDFLVVIDESHVTLPQLRGMYAGDQSRKKTLVEFGFRLPSAMDNRPLQFDEFLERVDGMVCTSATPGAYELERAENVVEQVIRPTGLLDPLVRISPVREEGMYPGQIGHFIEETEKTIQAGGRVIATTLTKKMAEDLSRYLKEKNIKSEYLHSDIKTIDRIKILTRFRKGEFDCLVGVNLLREGLDLPEVQFIGILDADKEGFLRSETSLVQIIGRAARNMHGHVVLYADTVTGSIERAVSETERRRALQEAYNQEHGITPETVQRKIQDITEQLESEHDKAVAANVSLDEDIFKEDPQKLITLKQEEMEEAVKVLDFETAAILRDEIRVLEDRMTRKGRRKTKKVV